MSENRPSAWAMELAAQAWCTPSTATIPMNVAISKAFAELLDAERKKAAVLEATIESLDCFRSERDQLEAKLHREILAHHDDAAKCAVFREERAQLDARYHELEAKCAMLEGTPFEKERKQLVEFLTANWPELRSVDAWPVERALFKLRDLVHQVDEANAKCREMREALEWILNLEKAGVVRLRWDKPKDLLQARLQQLIERAEQ